MASLELPKNQIVLGDYIPMYEPQSLGEALSEFLWEENNEATRERIRMVLDNWNLRHGTNIRYENLFYN